MKQESIVIVGRIAQLHSVLMRNLLFLLNAWTEFAHCVSRILSSDDWK